MSDQKKYTSKLRGDRVLVIGGSSGIGYSVAEALIENECEVIIASSSQDKVNAKIKQLETSYPSAKGRISGHACDLSNPERCEDNIKALLEKAGKLEHIVHTAGDTLAIVKVQDLNFEEILKGGMVRFFSVILLAKHAPAYLTGGPKSSITLTTGSVSEKPKPDWTLINGYATGLEGLTRGLALDLAPIRVNLVSPGVVATELFDAIGMSKEQKETVFEKAASSMTTGRIPEPSEVAEAYLYLMKDRNATGSVVSSNGGTLLVG